MLRLEVATFNGQPPAQALGVDIDELGGSIGRADGNTLVLSDEKRYISRTQAEVTFRGGSYMLRDLGSATPTFVNGTAVGNGSEVALHDGDEVRVGEYILRVSAPKHPASAPGAGLIGDDPFADLLPPAPSSPPPAPAAAAPPSRQSSAMDDPFGLPAASPHPQSQPGVIPADFDPFADLMPSAGPAAAPLPDDLNLGTSGGQSVDDLFGLKTANTWDPLGPQNGLDDAHGLQGGNDPLAGLTPTPQRAARPSAQRDDAPMLSGAFQPLRAQPPAPPVAAPPPAAAQPPAPPPAQPAPVRTTPNDMVVSWETPQSPAATNNEIRTVILPSPKRAAPASAPQPAAQAVPASAPVAQPAPAARPDPAPVAAVPQPARAQSAPAAQPARGAQPAPAAGARQDAASVSPQEPDALLKAFLEGAGISEMRIAGGLTPELMNLVGELLRESIRGTLDLLLARALTKREVRAQATVIVAKENNPLKFSPTVEAAFGHLLTPHGQGFMQPASAVRDAYNDLRSHQFGFMAGMRAALEGVLGRFDPAQLEGRLTKKSVLGSLMPSSRRAKLWELYEQLYREISREAQDDFQTLFGKEFLRAYEAQIDKLEQEDAANKR